MIQLTLGNSLSRIENLSESQYRDLREVLSYEDAEGAYFAGRLTNTKRYLLDRKGNYPSGIQYLVDNWLAGTPATLLDTRIKPKSNPGMFKLALGSIAPRPYQHEAVKVATSSARAGFEMCTGSGKSITMALLIHALQLRTLVIVPNLGLKEQLTETFRQLFGNLNNITVENIASPKLRTATNYDCLILDECHHAASTSYQRLNKTAWKGIYHRYFFSGTFFRSQAHEGLLFEGIAGQSLYKYTYRQAVKDGAVVPIEAYYLDVPKTVDIKGNETSWPSMYSELVVKNEPRNNLLITLLYRLQKSGVSTLCLVKEVSHGDTLSADGAFHFANGKAEGCSDLISRFSSGEIGTLVATGGVCAEGVDTRACEFVVIAGLGKSKNLLMQCFGRAIRLYSGKETAKVILLRDTSHKFTKSHFAAQCKVLKDEYDTVPTKLDLSD